MNRTTQSPTDEIDRISRQPLTRATIIGYSFGSLGTGIYASVPSLLLLFYMTETLSIPPALAAMAIFLPKIWDVLTDPIMGFISDRTRSPWGRRRPYLLVGAILMSVTFVFLFSTPAFESVYHRFIYVLVVFTLSATAYTIFAVPYIAMPSEMSTDHKVRTTIMSYRMGFVMTGILIGSAAAPYMVSWFGGGRGGYGRMSVVLGIICAISMLIAFLATRAAPQTVPQRSDRLGFKQHFAGALQSPAFAILVLVYLLQLTAMGVFSASVPYFVTYILGGDTAQIGAFFVVLVGASIVSMAAWKSIAHRLGKRLTFAIAAGFFGFGALSLYFIATTSGVGDIYLRLIITGAGLAGIQMLPFSMLTDVIYLDAMESGQAREGTFTGLWTASEKLGFAIGPLIVGLILSSSGFHESEVGQTVTQSEGALTGIRLAVGLLPGVAIICSAALLVYYPISESSLEALDSD